MGLSSLTPEPELLLLCCKVGMDLVVSVGTVVWHGGPMPSCLQMRAKSVGSCSFEERFCLPEVKKPWKKTGCLGA